MEGRQLCRGHEHGPISAALTATGFTLTIGAADLGNTTGFRFYVESQKSNAAGNALVAFDVAGTYTYALTTVAKVVASVKPASAAKALRPSSRFSVTASVGLSDGTTVAASSVSCSATVGGTRLGTAGQCAWTVPKTAGGKTVAISVTATYGGTPYTTRLTIPVLKK